MGSAVQTVASRLSGIGVWVGVGAEVGVGDGAKVLVGRLVGAMLVGVVVATCSGPLAGWQDVTTNARLRNRIFVKGNRTVTSLIGNDRILSLPKRSRTRKNTRNHLAFFEMDGACEVY